MGNADNQVNEYLSDPVRFADVVNNGFFDGNHVIDPAKLTELDSVSRDIPGMHKIRDIKKMYKDEAVILIIGVESQTSIHYAMPLRNLIYDAQTYEGQRRKIAKQHKDDKDLEGDEWLSRFSKDDKLLPVITLVVYYGLDPWDGPRTLHEMLAVSEELKAYMPLMMNYQLNLLEVMKIKDLDTYGDDLKMVFGFIKYQEDKKALQAFVDENKDLFTNVPADTCRTITAMANTEEITDYIIRDKDEKEDVNMCGALRGIKEDGAMRTRIEQIQKKKARSLDTKTIAEHVEVTENFVKEICRLIDENPMLDADALVEKYEESAEAEV
ncbi:MAG: Rpn family recombination-promoting nuclease/putative transposase [Lachnospiraceae bacterium]|nr:Rpn family recombination-promoting nuclease/putative transposase [Lachnospiraceae bacterium]